MKQGRERQPGGPRHIGEYPMTEAQSERAEAAIALAQEEARVNLRWNSAALAVVKEAADLMGVPYQTYLKMATYRQAVADLNAAKEVGRSASSGR
ncbi:MAG TPA: hypothetical protein V6D47_02705 [Oscillatoriaceae cyanobacterium]